MALLNLSLVTQALLRLIDLDMTHSPEWNPVDLLNVISLPPDKLAGDRTIGFYLYHILEDPQYKNLPSPGLGDAPLRFTPMGLQLSYLLTPHSDLADPGGPLEEQRLIGLAMKALHDNPVLSDSTQIAGTTVFPAALRGRDNRVRIALMPVQPNEAMQYWTVGAQAMRLAAYYQVSVVLLEPEPITSRTGRVLSYGVYTFLRGAPRLDGSRNQIQFAFPGSATPRELELQPAEVAIGGTLTFFGSELSDDRTLLRIRAAAAPESVEVDSIQWGVTATSESVIATVQEFAGSQVVLPGVYTAAVQTVAFRTLPDGTTRSFVKLSNETPFTIVPRIDTISPFVGGLATVTGLNFDPALLPDETIQVFLGPERLARVTANPPAAGEFVVVDRTTLRFRLPAGLPSGEILPFRLLIRGAESAPRWVTTP